jgi:putative resolvase
LARIGYELIKHIIEKYSQGKIIILEGEQKESPLNEITKDILAIMNIYVAKINGKRKYKV